MRRKPYRPCSNEDPLDAQPEVTISPPQRLVRDVQVLPVDHQDSARWQLENADTDIPTISASESSRAELLLVQQQAAGVAIWGLLPRDVVQPPVFVTAALKRK